jgi:hypothetical protein
LIELLAQRKGVIAGKWLDRIVASYPADTANFLKRKQDRFANPVGSTLAKGTTRLVEALFDGMTADSLREAIEPIVKIRAVQDFSASSAVAFVFQLKDVIREVAGDELSGDRPREQLEQLERRIDKLALVAFDVYSSCREQVANIRVEEVKRNVAHVLKRSGWFEDPQQGGD